MSSTLSEGVRVPDIGSVNWGADVNFNWGLLNTALANISGNVKVDAENTWTAPQTFTETISGSIDGVAARAVGDEDGNNIKTALAGKQPSLSQSQLDAVNSGITSAAVQQIGTNASNISGLQTAMASKAADNAVVHLAGAETITGDKTFTGATVTHNIRPLTDGTYNLGTNQLRWTRLYTSENIFIHYKDLTFGVTPAETIYFGLRLNDNTGAVYGDVLMRSGQDGNNILRFRCRNTDGTNIYDRQISFIVNSGGITQFVPNATGVFDLGRESAKWKTLNGINPGNLSIPNMTSLVDISGSLTSFDGTAIDISSIITVPGWINIVIPYVAGDYIRFALGRAGGATAFRNSRYIISGSSDGDFISVFVPVSTGLAAQVNIKASGGAVTQARFYPCLGNV